MTTANTIAAALCTLALTACAAGPGTAEQATSSALDDADREVERHHAAMMAMDDVARMRDETRDHRGSMASAMQRLGDAAGDVACAGDAGMMSGGGMMGGDDMNGGMMSGVGMMGDDADAHVDDVDGAATPDDARGACEDYSERARARLGEMRAWMDACRAGDAP